MARKCCVNILLAAESMYPYIFQKQDGPRRWEPLAGGSANLTWGPQGTSSLGFPFGVLCSYSL